MIKILVPTAGPVPARENADYIMDIAEKLNAEIIAIHIADTGETAEGKHALEIFGEVGTKRNIKTTTMLKRGEVVGTIAEVAEAEKVNLIVMGASSGRLVADWIVTDVRKKTKIPVVIIPYGFSELL
jgi:nucleotide-binding universal stress UspA family protein